MNIFIEECSVGFTGIDQSDTLTIASVCDLFQEAAISHAEILGVGREAMKDSGQVWILSRLSVFMDRRPRFGEKITIRTWPRNSNKLFAIRDYDIHPLNLDETGIVRGRSAWLVVDLEKRRPLRPEAVVEKLPANEGINALPGANPPGNSPPPSLSVREFILEQSVLRRACYSDIDFNGHVNNTRYIQWIQDLLDPEILVKAQQIRLDINYLAEVRHGETIRLFMLPIDTQECDALPGQTPLPCKAAFAIEGRREPEAIPVFRAELRTG
jgi:acyl-ACP thioesterase